jgi:hypothetical protein
MASHSVIDTVRRALRLTDGISPSEQAQASRWLQTYGLRQEAWAGAVELLSVPESSIAHFGANILLSKIRTDWRSSAQPTRQLVFTALSDYVQRVLSGVTAFDNATLSRVSVAMANAAALDSESAVCVSAGICNVNVPRIIRSFRPFCAVVR